MPVFMGWGVELCSALSGCFNSRIRLPGPVSSWHMHRDPPIYAASQGFDDPEHQHSDRLDFRRLRKPHLAFAAFGGKGYWKLYLIYTCWVFLELCFVYFAYVETRGPTLGELSKVIDGMDANVAHVDLAQIEKEAEVMAMHGAR
ncbi:hexose transporter protein [Seiridium cupressi]